MGERPEDVDAAAEVERLRELVGPSERSYRALRDDVEAAEQFARAAAVEAGELRGQLAEMSVQLSRARQDQDLLMRQIDMTATERLADRASRRWTASVAPRLRRLLKRS